MTNERDSARSRFLSLALKGMMALSLLAAVGGAIHAQCYSDRDCDDGNPCTNDYCVYSYYGSYCTHTFNTLPCDDHNACTRSDQCSNGTCTGIPVSCDDGNACTLDTCDLATGACVHVGPPGEVGNLRFINPLTLVWDPLPEALIYNTYRGLIPGLGGLGGLAVGPYNHFCFESGDAQLNGATLTVDNEALPEGAIRYYLVDGELNCGEGTLGTASNGTLRPNPFPCPTPPP